MVRLAIITKSATTHSGSRAPIDLTFALRKSCDLTIFAEAKNAQKSLKNKLKKLKLYKSPMHLYQLLKLGNFDVISFHSTFLEMIAARLVGIPIVRTYYGTQFDAYLERFTPDQKPDNPAKIINSLANFLIWANQKVMLALSDKVVAISEAAQKELKKLYWQNSRVIYLGSNLKPKTNREPSTARLASLAKRVNRQLTILSVSRITPYKGFHKLIEVIKNVRAKTGLDIKLVIAGSLGKANYLKYLQSNLSTSDQFQIITSPTDKTLSKLYSQCDIYATCDRHLFFGLPILEAAQFAKPAVAANYLAAKELIIHGKTGFVANSPDELTKYLIILIKDKQKRLKVGKAAQVISVEKFDIKKIASIYLQIFTDLKSHQIPRLQDHFLLFLILLFTLGVAIRIIFSFILPLDGGDETYQLLTSQKPILPSLATTLNAFGPMWTLILHLLEKISTNYFHIRVVTSIIGSLSIVVAAYLGKSLFNTKIGLVSALVFALSPTQIYYSANIRQYSLTIFATLLILLSFIKFLKSNSTGSSFSLFLVSVFGNYVNHFSPIISTFFISFLLLFKKSFRKKVKKFILIFIMSLFASLPFFLAFLTVEKLPQPASPSITLLKIITLPLHFTFPLNLAQLTGLYPKLEVNYANLLLLLLSIFAFCIVVLSILKKPDKKLFFLILTLIGPILVMAFLSLIGYPTFGFRTLLVFSTPFYLLLAKGLTDREKLFKIYIIFTTITLISTLYFFINKPYPLENFLARSLEPQQILIHTEFTTYTYFSYLMPKIQQAAAVDSLYRTNADKKLLQYYPIDAGSLKGKSFWLLAQSTETHKILVAQFKNRLSKTHKIVFARAFDDMIFYDMILYKYEPLN